MSDAPVTVKAARAAFAFSENVVENSIQVARHTEGADITAVVAGVGTLRREFSVFKSSNIDNLYTKIMTEADQIQGGAIQDVMIQVTDNVVAQFGSLQAIQSNARAAVDDLRRLYNRNVRVTVITGDARQLFPSQF